MRIKVQFSSKNDPQFLYLWPRPRRIARENPSQGVPDHGGAPPVPGQRGPLVLPNSRIHGREDLAEKVVQEGILEASQLNNLG